MRTKKVGAGSIVFGCFLAALLFGCGGSSTPPSLIAVSLSSPSATVIAGTSMQFIATVSNDPANGGVNWTVTCTVAGLCGSVSPPTTSSGAATTYNAPATTPGTDLIIRLTATSVSDASKSQSAMITVPAITVSLTPTSANVTISTTAAFTPTVNNDGSGSGVTWALTQNGAACSPGCGTVSPASTFSGVAATYSAPATLPATNMAVTLTATSVSDTTKSASATITVPSVAVAVSPASAMVPGNGTAQLTATIAGDSSNKGAAWAVSCATSPCGNVAPASSASGTVVTYTAPGPPSADLPVTVTATSVANSLAAGSTTVTVLAITVGVQPPAATIEAGTTAKFTAMVGNDLANKGVTWTVTCSSASCGSVSASSTASGAATTYTAPAPPPPSDLNVTITATSVSDSTKSSTATVTVPAITVSSVSPPTGIIPINATQTFSATVLNDPSNAGLNWTLTQNGTSCSPACGTVNPASTASNTPTTYTAPSTVPASASVALNAVSAADTSKLSTATLTLTNGTVKLIPAHLSFSCKFRAGTNPGCTTATTQTITLTNTGNAALSINSISITTATFTETNDCGSSVAAGAACTITVGFQPTSISSFVASVSISDSSPDSPQAVTLFGSARQIRRGDGAALRSELSAANSAAVPAPTGSEIVGTRVLHLTDLNRDDPYLNNGTKRELAVRLWYPASPKSRQSCERAPYTSAAVWNYFAQLVGIRPFAVTTNSCWEAPVADGAHPVVVFSPGYTATFTDYTFLMEELASHGYVVASIAHTYETTAVDLRDGRLAKSVVGSHLAGPMLDDGRSLSSTAYIRFLDLKFVVSELERSNVQSDSALRSKLDLSRIAVAGHSLGASTALLAIQFEPRFKAAVMMDGFVPAALPSETSKPVLLMAANRESWESTECRLWSNLKGPRLAVNLPGTEHVAMGDWIWLTTDSVATGPMGPQKTMSAIRDYVTAFLDANLRSRTLEGTREQLLSGRSLDYPDVAVTTDQQSLCGSPRK